MVVVGIWTLWQQHRNRVEDIPSDSSLGNPDAARGEGVLCSDSGAWINAFSRNIGITTSFLAELWVLRDGQIMCLNLRINALEAELDAKVVVELMSSTSMSNAVSPKKKK